MDKEFIKSYAQGIQYIPMNDLEAITEDWMIALEEHEYRDVFLPIVINEKLRRMENEYE